MPNDTPIAHSDLRADKLFEMIRIATVRRSVTEKRVTNLQSDVIGIATQETA
jgi:hypothetical protein